MKKRFAILFIIVLLTVTCALLLILSHVSTRNKEEYTLEQLEQIVRNNNNEYLVTKTQPTSEDMMDKIGEIYDESLVNKQENLLAEDEQIVGTLTEGEYSYVFYSDGRTVARGIDGTVTNYDSDGPYANPDGKTWYYRDDGTIAAIFSVESLKEIENSVNAIEEKRDSFDKYTLISTRHSEWDGNGISLYIRFTDNSYIGISAAKEMGKYNAYHSNGTYLGTFNSGESFRYGSIDYLILKNDNNIGHFYVELYQSIGE
ncbi:MAG: hypothetical protein J6K72_12270 [Clostridia bacterium]|nr:hypothetical protein [Clostridia bacterium]